MKLFVKLYHVEFYNILRVVLTMRLVISDKNFSLVILFKFQ